MNARNYVWIGIGAALAVALAILCLSPPAAATNDPLSTGGTVYGDWTVTDIRTYENASINVSDGNLVISNGGSLTLNKVNLRMNSSSDGAYSISVNQGGTLITNTGTAISSNTTTYHYKFVVKGTMKMNGSSVSEMWGDNASWAGGIQIYSDSVTINSSVIFNGRTGGISIFDCSPTVTNSTIRNNGQDGGSERYCFGMYLRNSKAVIDYNTVTNNVYTRVISSRSNVYIYDWPVDNYYGYAHQYNGKWYYGWNYYGYYNGYPTYYAYRQYQYQLTYYNVSGYWGVGIYIDSSTITLNSNSILTNGLGSAGYTYSNYYGQTTISYDTNGPYGSSYYYWRWEYQYLYYYYYTAVSCFGEGLHVEKSTLTLFNNVFDKNGFQSRHDYYPSEQNIGWYSGVNANLYDCTATITNNTISSASILLNLTRCTVTITGNKFLGDYVGGGAYYSVNFIPGRVGYGIRYYESKGDIINNTIDFKFKDYPVYIGGGSMYFADLVTAVDFPGAKDTTFSGNKVTMDSQYYGMVRGILFNTSLKATNLKVLNCTFDYKYTGAVSSGAKPVTSMFVISLKSEAYIAGCTFKTAAGSYPPTINGLVAEYGTVLTVVDSTFSGQSRPLVVTDFSTLTTRNVTVSGALDAALYLDAQSKATLTSCKLGGTGRGILAVRSRVDIYTCTLSNAREFEMDRGANINVWNTPHTKNSFLALDDNSYLNVSWPISLTVQWQNDVPVENAEVAISTIAGAPVLSGITGADGSLGSGLWIKEYSVHLKVANQFNPHRITVSKGRASSMDMFIIDKAMTVEFRLTDNVPPGLSVTSPLDGERLNHSMVAFSGLASDPEAGLLDDVVEINIDNTGWVPVSVDPAFGNWSYARPLGDGLHVVRVKASDLVGNVARDSLSVSVDTTGPVLYVFTPAEGSYTNQRTMTVTGVTEEGVFVTVNGISTDVVKRMFSKKISLDVGPNVISVVASDSAGNSRSVQVHVTFDIQPPLLDVRSPRNGDYTNQDPLSVIGSSEPNAVIMVNGVRAQLLNSSFESLVGMSEGANTVTVTALDQAGNMATMVLTVYLDTAAPGLTIFSPRDGLWTNQSKVLISGATEQGALVTINGQNTNVVSTIFSGSVALLEGANRIELVAKDPAGNSQRLSRTVFLDTRRPDLIVTSPGDRLILASRVVPVVGSVDYGAEVRVDGELVQVTDFVFSTTVSYAEDGTHVVEITARDQAGNLARVTRTVMLDTTTPPIILSYPVDGISVKQRLITVSGQTEPFATVIVNTETLLVVGRDGLFMVPVVLEDGENRITVTTTDAAGNSQTSSVTVTKPVTKAVATEDLSWVLNLTGLLVGIGIALPIMTHTLTSSWRRRREGVLSELDAAESARKEREAVEARRAALPTVEKMGKKRAKAVEAPVEEKAPAVLPEAPKAEAAAPDLAKAGLKDKSGTTEVSPDEIDQETRMKAKPESPAQEKTAGKDESAESSLKDKGGESEDGAGDTEIQSKKK